MIVIDLGKYHVWYVVVLLTLLSGTAVCVWTWAVFFVALQMHHLFGWPQIH